MAALMIFAGHSIAQDAPDTTGSRIEAATRYADKYDIRSRMDSLAEKVAAGLPPKDREQFFSLVKKHLNIDGLRRIQIDGMVKTFTAREINTLVSFISTEDGRSVIAKFGTYYLAVMPEIKAEVARTLAEAKADLNGTGKSN